MGALPGPIPASPRAPSICWPSIVPIRSIIYASTEGHYSDPKGFQGLFKSADGGGRWQAINKGWIA